MGSPESDGLAGYPTLSAAAKILRVAPSTLSRRSDITPLVRGQRDKVLRPDDVLHLARSYRKVGVSAVAQELKSYAAKHAPEEALGIAAEIDRVARDSHEYAEKDLLLRLAQRHLPPDVSARVEQAVNEEDAPARVA